MTLKEIAALSGVHSSTVSRILNSPDDSFASREVREKVWKIVRETGYVPNHNAQSLRKRGTREVPGGNGLIDCILGRTKNMEDNPFFSGAARAVAAQALSLGYSVQVFYSALEPETHPLAIKSARQLGAVVLGRFENEAVERILESQYKNIVYLGRNPINAAWDQIICDGYMATQTALEHLISCGHTRIAYIGERKHEVRYKAYMDMAAKDRLEKDSSLIVDCPQNGAGGFQGAERLLKQAKLLPTAIFCATDVVAIAVMSKLLEVGIRVPEQVSVIGMDNIDLAGYVSPMLTTVEIPMIEMANVAVQTLISRIKKLHRIPLKITLPCKLVIRRSVASINSGAFEGMYI
ncbi:MAG: LacI family transcriptional regulator [Synergistaceae bacterium]|nr:LacI family transcriptional regulator [Synergistaceae bacterium]